MFNISRYHHQRSPFSQFADQIITLELISPFPLIVVGLLRVLEPLLFSFALVMALLPWFVRWLVFGKLTQRTFLDGPFVLMVIGAFIGVWVSYDPTLSWPLLLTLLGSVSLFFVIINIHISPQWVARGLVVVASLIALYFVGQYRHFHYDEVGWLARLGQLTSSLSPNLVFLTPHPNAVASFLESVWLLSLVLAWQAHNGERVVWGLIVAIITYGLLISGSRGAGVGLAVAVVIWAMLLIQNRSLRLAIAGIGLVGAVLGVYAMIQIALTQSPISILTSVLETAISRLTLYRNSLYLLSDYPFTGIGLGDVFGMVYSRYQLLIPVRFLTYSHNLFLSTGLGLGVLGLVALAWLLISFYCFVVRVEQAGMSAQFLSLFRAAWLGVTVTFLHGLTDSPQFNGSGWTMPMLLAGLGLTIVIGRSALIENSEGVAEGLMGTRQHWRWLVLGTVALVMIVATVIFWRPLLSAWYMNMGAIQQTRAELSPNLDDSVREAAAMQAMNDFAYALSLNPAQPGANRRLGLIALDRDNFETAMVYLEQAYRQEPRNQATLKSLGYAYLWTGRLDLAEKLFRQLDLQGALIKEFNYWSSWRSSRGHQDLAGYASNMAQRLAVDP